MPPCLRILSLISWLVVFPTVSAVDVVQITATPGATAVVISATPTAVVVDPGLTVTNTSSTPITIATVVVGTGSDAGPGNDALALPSPPAGFASSFDANTSTLSITAPAATAAQWQAALRTVTFSTNGRIARPRTISFALGSAKPLNTNGHFYEVINVPTGITWQNARTAAAARQLYGLQGYLTTITTSSENTFVVAKVQNDAWIGAVDDFAEINTVVAPGTYIDQAASEGYWYWVTGPEAGQLFFRDPPRTPAGAVNGAFSNWATNEPNNAGAEHYGHIRFSGNTGGRWNDYVFNNSNVKYYVVEFGGMPGDPAVVLQASRTVAVEWAAPTISAPTGTQAIARPIISGVAANAAGPGKIEVGLDLTNDGVTDVVFVATTAANGTWSVDTASASPFSGTMADLGPSGTTRVSARSFNILASSGSGAAANAGPFSTTVFTTDRVPPAAPLINGPTSPTNDTTPVISGAAEPGATVTITIDPDGNPMTADSFVLITTADTNGAWSVTVPGGTPLVDGTSPTLSVTAADALGNTSTATNATIAVDASAPDAPAITGPGALTNDRTPLVSGTAEPGALITVVIDPDNNPATDDSITWLTTADPSGAWVLDTGTTPVNGTMPSDGLPENTIAISVTATDAVGNTSAPSSTTTLIDATAPAAPTFSGPSSPTNDASPTITGGGEAGATLTLTIDVDGDLSTTADIVTFVVPVAADGSWAVDTSTLTPTTGSMPGGGFPDGLPVVLSATQTDAAGNTSPNTTIQLAIDTTPPAAPLVLAPGTITNDQTPTISGIAEPGTTVRVVIDTDNDPDTDGDRIVLTTTADPITGAWSVTLTDPLIDGSINVLEATAADAAGNTGPASSSTLVIDTTAPIPPLLTGPIPTTASATPVLSGQIDDDTDTLVVIIDPNGDGDLSDQLVYTLTRGAGLPLTGTTWSLDLATAIPDGGSVPMTGLADGSEPIVTLLASDNVGNTSAAGATFNVDLSEPLPPVITGPGTVSADATPVITGTAEAGSLITVIVGGVTFTTTADGAGQWQIDTGSAIPTAGSVPVGGFANGSLAISATATDGAGNTSTATTGSTVIDTVAPATPLITGPGSLTIDTTPLITGTAEPGSSVTVRLDPDGDPTTANNVVYVVVADGAGAWAVDTGSATPVSGVFSPLAVGTPFTVGASASDAAGNHSGVAQVSSQVVDGTGVATVTLVNADRLFTGQPQTMPVTADPNGLALRVRWRLANDPLATVTELDPNNAAHANRWPSAAGTYTVQAVVVEPGWSGLTTATLLIYVERSFDLHSNRCGNGGLFVGLLLLALALGLRSARGGVLGLFLLANVGVQAAEGDPASATTPTPVRAPAPSPTAALPAAAIPAGPLPEPTPIDPPRWWVLRLGWGPDAQDDSERRSDDTLVSSDWERSLRLTLQRDLRCGWIPSDTDGPLVRLGIALQRLAGDENWMNSNGDDLSFETRALGVSLAGLIGWEAQLGNGLFAFFGPCGSLGPVVGHVDGRLTSGPNQWDDDTYTYGWQFSYGLEGGLGWRGDTWGVELGSGYERQRVSISYELDSDLDGTDRGETWDRRLDVVGWWWTVGVSRRW